MKVLVTVTVQFETDMREGTTENEAIHNARTWVEDLFEGPGGCRFVGAAEVCVENLETWDGGFK